MNMIVVTGGAGFIGSNLVRALNREGQENILVVDDLTDGDKFKNIVDCRFRDYLDRDEFMELIRTNDQLARKIRIVFHEGACTSTIERDGRFMMENNYRYSKLLLEFCLARKIQFIYASSAAVYGAGKNFREDGGHEEALNIYGYSKYLFDEYVRLKLKSKSSQVVGLRYYNVYGPREQHKGLMASVIYHFNAQVRKDKEIRLFKGSGGYADGEQRRDFIYVDDVVKINLWMMSQPGISGIFNSGTGRSHSFNDVAKAVIKWHGFGKIKYIEFPDNLIGKYQNFTQADIAALRNIGYEGDFQTIETGIPDYLTWLNK